MESLVIERGDTTPQLDFNIESFQFTLEGECRPENVLTFFEPVMKWLDQFLNWAPSNANGKKLDFHFKLEYYNSSSSKFVYNIFKRLKELMNQGVNITMFWFYDILDEDLLECGQEYEKILGLKFEFIALQD